MYKYYCGRDYHLDVVIPISIILIDVIIMWAVNASDNDYKGKMERD